MRPPLSCVRPASYAACPDVLLVAGADLQRESLNFTSERALLSLLGTHAAPKRAVAAVLAQRRVRQFASIADVEERVPQLLRLKAWRAARRKFTR